MKEKPTKLYRHFDKNGALLYVGISTNEFARFSQHENFSKWFNKISNITFESYKTWEEAQKKKERDELRAAMMADTAALKTLAIAGYGDSNVIEDKVA